MNRRLSRIFPALAFLSIVLAGCGGHATNDTGADAPAMLADTDVATSAASDLTAGLPVSGTLEPITDVRIGAPIGEVVEAVAVREGQRVQRGQVLARFRASALGPAAAGAAAELQAASSEYQRAQNLFKAGAMSKRDVETAEARFKSAQANGAQADKMFSDAVVRAPLSGVIAEKFVDSGSRPGIGDPMFRLVDTHALEFEATVPSEYVRSVKPGAPVRLDISGFPAGSLTGRVARVNATADAATRQVKVYVAVPNRDGALVGGLYAHGVIVTGEALHSLAVPDAAVRSEGDSTFVYTLDGGRFTRHAVSTGVRDADRGLTEIRSGLGAGATVIIGAVEGLAPGQRVTVGGAASDSTTGAKGH